MRWTKDKLDILHYRKTKQEDPSPACQWDPEALLKTALHLKFRCLIHRLSDCFTSLHVERKRERARLKAYSTWLEKQEASRQAGEAQQARQKKKGREGWSGTKKSVDLAADVKVKAQEALANKKGRENEKGKKGWGKMGSRANVGSFTSNIWHEQVLASPFHFAKTVEKVARDCLETAPRHHRHITP